uniref:Crossover junction endonuclease MUS81 n=1 Tax=Triticum urartu TaxID=4572 RepID=A0A8R7VD43_TRIUA
MAAQQPGGLPDHQTRALSAAYTGVCAAKEPVRTPGDLARLKGVGGWVVDVMEDSFPGSSLDLSPPRSNTPGETGRKNTRNKPYVPRLKSAAYAIMITLYREMERGKEFMMRQELIDAAEASGLSEHAIGSNNSRNSRNDGYSYTGWNSMKKLTNKDLVKKKSNPAKYYLTEKGKETARDCLARSGLDGPAGPLTAASHPAVVLSD